MRRQAIAINEEEAQFDYRETRELVIYKGNCIVDIRHGLSREEADNYIKRFKDFRYLFIPLNNEEYDEFNKYYSSIKNLSDIAAIDIFVHKYGFNPKDIIAQGNVSVTSAFLHTIIPHVKFVTRGRAMSRKDVLANKKNGQYTYSFKRFTSKTLNSLFGSQRANLTEEQKDKIKKEINYHKTCMDNMETACLIAHEDAMSSWNGLLNITKNPRYAIIVKHYNNEIIYSKELDLELDKI